MKTAEELAPAMLLHLLTRNAEARVRRIAARALFARRSREGRAIRQQQTQTFSCCHE